MASLNDTIAALDRLPALPATSMRLISLLAGGGQDADLREIESIISHDEAVTATVLRRANSAAFGMRGRAGRMAYSASKWGLRGITKSFALEVGPYNINVNCVAPGMVDGPRFREKVCANMAQKLGITLEEAMTRHAADYALRRVSTDEDVANACLFLASAVSRQITGVDLPVDGGWAML